MTDKTNITEKSIDWNKNSENPKKLSIKTEIEKS